MFECLQGAYKLYHRVGYIMGQDRPEKKRKLDEKTYDEKVAELSSKVDFFYTPKKLKFSDIKKIILQHFLNRQYTQLKQFLSSHGFLATDRIREFFSKHGATLLGWTLVESSDSQSLELLVDIVPKETLQTTIKQNNCEVLKPFLYAQAAFENTNRNTPAFRDLQVKKFKLLLGIDRDSIVEFMQRNVVNKYMLTDKVKNNFKKALSELSEENGQTEIVGPGI